jgi:putative Holliday junction resolvase
LDEGVELVLVGLPLTLDGREGLAARKCRKFSEELAVIARLPVQLVDERLSTVEAQARLHEAGGDIKGTRSRIDSASAAILLQSWLDGSRMRENS